MAEEEIKEQEQPAVHHGNTRLPYGLCKRYNITLPDDATPRDAWNALKEKGITPEKVYQSLKASRKKYTSKTPQLKDDEREAVEWYASGDGMFVNNALRGIRDLKEADLTEEERQNISKIDKATQNAVGENKTLFRSVDASAIFGNIPQMQLENAFDYIRGYKGKFEEEAYNKYIVGTVGKTIEDKGFVSTTKNKGIADEWGDYTGSDNPIVIRFKTSKNTKGLDFKENKVAVQAEESEPQEEVLLARNQKYTIKKIYYENGNVYIDADFV